MNDDRDMNAFRRRLEELGVKISGEAEFRTYTHRMDRPHAVLRLDRVSTVGRPDYTVCAFTQCAICREICYLDPMDAFNMATRDVLPICVECHPKSSADDYAEFAAMDDQEKREFVHDLMGKMLRA